MNARQKRSENRRFNTRLRWDDPHWTDRERRKAVKPPPIGLARVAMEIRPVVEQALANSRPVSEWKATEPQFYPAEAFAGRACFICTAQGFCKHREVRVMAATVEAWRGKRG